MIIDPQWLAIARPLVGLHEVKGAEHSPEILGMWRAIKRSGIQNDETPWCAAFAGACLERAGIRSSRFESAASYLKWGVRLDGPAHGCIVVFSRDGGGHVGFVVGMDKGGNLLVLGGNQGDICYVVAMDYGGDTLTTLGHELKHCFDGAWHPVNGIISNRTKD